MNKPTQYALLLESAGQYLVSASREMRADAKRQGKLESERYEAMEEALARAICEVQRITTVLWECPI